MSKSDVFRGFKFSVEQGESALKRPVIQGYIELRNAKEGYV